MFSKFFYYKLKDMFRYKGDKCREARDWSGAVIAYERHLTVNPADQPIWTQLGHAWKEQGYLENAAKSYQAAADLDTLDADAYMHLADVLRHLGRREAAISAYEHVIDLLPNLEAMQQIRFLRPQTQATQAIGLGEGTIFFTIQDLFGYLKSHVTMSGIQRVQAGICLHAIKNSDINVILILGNSYIEEKILPADEFWMIDNVEFIRIINYASGQYVDHEILKMMILLCEDNAKCVKPIYGSKIIISGAFWGLGNYTISLLSSKRNGVKICACVYDIIPITHPEYCDDNLVAEFSTAIFEICSIADFILTISDATRISLTDFIVENGWRSVPMETVPLAHHLLREDDAIAMWPEQLRQVQGKRYVVYVSTIEGRKNHLYVINAWQQLIAEGVDVPDLVFVGRLGWKIDALTDMLAATENLNGRLHIAHNLSDGELSAVYANSVFSVFTSFVEGWGLPVGESLFYGRPCVASNTSSIPEVGGNLVDYVDPLNLAQGVEVFRRMITDLVYLRSRAEDIREHFAVRSWDDVGADFIEKIKNINILSSDKF